MKSKLVIGAGICFAALFVQVCQFQDRNVLGRWETTAPDFRLRITEVEDVQFPLSKFKYVFEAKPNESDEWHEIMTATTDDDVPIPREQVRVIGNQVAYVFMTDQYAVTRDGGRSWFNWKANERISNVEFPEQFVITEVLVNPDGTGALTVASRSAATKTMHFRSEDFGQSWVPK